MNRKYAIIGYNLKGNFGDDLMLYSNLKFLNKKNKNKKIDIIIWGKPNQNLILPNFLDDFNVSIKYYKPTLNYIVYNTLRVIFNYKLIIVGGGNLFDNRRMGIYLSLIIISTSIFVNHYLRGIGVGRKNKWLDFINKLGIKIRPRDNYFANKIKHEDTAIYSIKKLSNKLEKSIEFKKTNKLLFVVRNVKNQNNFETSWENLIDFNNINEVLILNIDNSANHEEILLANKFKLYFEEKGLATSIKSNPLYEEIFKEIFSSNIIISQRLHISIVTLLLCPSKIHVILPYSEKFISEFGRVDLPTNTTLMKQITSDVN